MAHRKFDNPLLVSSAGPSSYSVPAHDPSLLLMRHLFVAIQKIQQIVIKTGIPKTCKSLVFVVWCEVEWLYRVGL